jgi:hypothetical protein
MVSVSPHTDSHGGVDSPARLEQHPRTPDAKEQVVMSIWTRDLPAKGLSMSCSPDHSCYGDSDGEDYVAGASVSSDAALGFPSRNRSTKAPRDRRRREQETEGTFRFPELHDEIAKAVAPSLKSIRFHGNERKKRYRQSEIRVLGKFTCNNPSCKVQPCWCSHDVSVHIRE